VTKVFAFWQNRQLETVTGEGALVVIVPKEAKEIKRSFIRVSGYNGEGVSNDILIPLENGKIITSSTLLNRFDKEAQIMYFTLVDRFNDGNKKNNNPIKDARVLPQANWQGGDLAGITQKIRDGYFKSLNINSIWISPITKNPDSAYQEFPEPHRWYTGYHGYWPTLSSMIDPHFGVDGEMQELVKVAHENGINILLDYVCHHVHVEHPLYKAHPNWVTKLDLPNGKKNIRIWDEERLTTWFDTFIPTLDLAQPEVIEMNTDSTLYWLKKYDLDGYRQDAAKHIPLPFWRRLTQKAKTEFTVIRDKPVYQIGETYGSRELIQSYIGSGMMDSQFDFPLYFDLREVFINDQSSFQKAAEVLDETFSYFGNHNSMGYMTGNHDQARFISLAGGALKSSENDREAGFSRYVGVGDSIGYKKLSMLTAFMFAIPGVPCVYYGDEIGIPGAGDPDNRRMMRFDGLSSAELRTRECASKLTELRRSRMSLTYGETDVLRAGAKSLVVSRDYFGEWTVSVFNKDNKPADIVFELPKRFNVKDLNAHFGAKVRLSGSKIYVHLEPWSFDVLTN
jgi:cyclomaltodextrinase / maltogenic alpha-amylase / neopullulanase